MLWNYEGKNNFIELMSNVFVKFVKIGFVGLLLTVIVILCLNHATKQTNWYQNVIPAEGKFPDVEALETERGSLDFLLSGSSSGIYDFELGFLPIKSYNMALQPQSTERSYDILRKYHKLLRRGGTFAFVFVPFSGLTIGDGRTRKYDRYYYVFDCHSYEDYDKSCFRRKWPLLADTRLSLSKLFVDDNPIQKPRSQRQLNDNEFVNDAQNMAWCWRWEFDVDEFADSLSEINKVRRATAFQTLTCMGNFCKENNIQFVIIIPPCHRTLLHELGASTEQLLAFKTIYVDSIINDVKYSTNVTILDYLNDSTFSECDSIWASSLFMNKIGAKLFTRQVLTDIGILR